MFRKLTLALLLLVSFTGYSQSFQLDTVYFDSYWKQIRHKEFASYFRVLEVGDSETPKKYRTYKSSGELFSEGQYLSMDNESDAKTLLHGENILYYPSGQVKEKLLYANGKRDGQYVLYFENGLTNVSATYVDDQLNGLYTEFLMDGSCKQVEYILGQPKDNAYVIVNQNGCVSKYDITTNKAIYVTPSKSDVQTVYVDGVAWQRYQQNGLTISTTIEEVVDYGRYYKLYIVLANNSNDTITFDPTKIRCTNAYPNCEGSHYVFSAEEYLKRVSNRQTFRAVMYGLAVGLAAADAGHSRSISHISSRGYGSVRTPYASANYSHYGRMTVHTTTYNAAASYQATLLASAQIAGFQYLQRKEYQSKKNDYLKLNTIEPGKVISGYVNIERNTPHYALDITMDVGGVDYVFSWEDGTFELAQVRAKLTAHRDSLSNDIDTQFKYLKENPQEISQKIELFEALVNSYNNVCKELGQQKNMDAKVRKLKKIAQKQG